MTKVSVIIPCYNQGEFLPEAVDSVLTQTHDNVEIIIVDDGSDDDITASTCAALQGPGIRLLTTENQGLAAARNNGIAAADGTYILPLDADDRIAPDYIAEAVTILDSEPQTGIVYCRARLFGAVEGDWQLPDYSLEQMLRDNLIFCTALFRKKDWEEVGGYDPGMVYGWEDYDFWLSLIERGRGVHRLDGRFFFYRVSPESMVRSKEKSQKVEMFKRIFQRHQTLFSDHLEAWLEPLLDLREQYLICRLYIDCGKGLSDEYSVSRKIEPGRRTIRFPLDQFGNLQALRFDPADCPVSIEVDAVELSGDDKKLTLDPGSLHSNADFRDGSSYLFTTDDPQMFFGIDVEELEGIQECAVTINLKSYGEEALRAVIRRLRDTQEQTRSNFSLAKIFASRKG